MDILINWAVEELAKVVPVHASSHQKVGSSSDGHGQKQQQGEIASTSSTGKRKWPPQPRTKRPKRPREINFFPSLRPMVSSSSSSSSRGLRFDLNLPPPPEEPKEAAGAPEVQAPPELAAVPATPELVQAPPESAARTTPEAEEKSLEASTTAQAETRIDIDFESLQWVRLFGKKLTRSDTSNLYRMVIPKVHATKLPKPPMPVGPKKYDNEILMLEFVDENSARWSFRYKYCESNRSHTLTTNWHLFLKAYGLHAGDEVSFWKKRGSGTYGIRAVKAPVPQTGVEIKAT